MSKAKEIAIIDKNIRFFFTLFAVLTPRKQTKIKRICYSVYKLIAVILIYVNFIFLIIGLVTCRDLLQRMLIVASTATNLVSIVNFHIFQCKNSNLEKLLEGIVICSKWKNHKNGFLTFDIAKSLYKVRILAYIFCINVTIALQSKYILYMVNGNLKLRLLPVRVWIPFEGEELYKFVIIFFTQYISMSVVTYICLATLFLTIYGVCYVAFEFKSLAFDYNNCIFETLNNHGVPRHLVLRFRKCFIDNNIYHQIEKYDIRMRNIALQLKKEKVDKELLRNLKKYIQRHQCLVQLSKVLEDLIKPTQLVFIFSMIIVFIVNISQVFVIIEFQIIQIAFSVAISIFNCFAAGELLRTMSHKIETAVYSTPWYLCSLRTQKMFFTILQLSQRTASIRIIWHTLDLQNFIKIFGNVYSLLATLRPMFVKYKQ